METQHSKRNNRQSTLYLIAHKVRGEAAFDVAHRIKCPICEPIQQGVDEAERGLIHCSECDDGYWWIIGTSGHRAYPFWHTRLEGVLQGELHASLTDGWLAYTIANMPNDLPDHYQTTAAPGTGKVKDLLSKLALPRVQQPQVMRRI